MTNEIDSAGSATPNVRYYFSRYHLFGAQHFAELAQEVEDRHSGDEPNPSREHRAYVINAVLSAVAFLEAAINEVYEDVVYGAPVYVGPLSEETKRSLAAQWKCIERGPTLKKYQTALRCNGTDTFDKGKQPYQDASLLIELRNQLVHSRPFSQTIGEKSTHNLEEKLKGKFKPSRLMDGSPNPYFPGHCLGAGCAAWAVKSARALADEFFRRIGIQPTYQLASEP